MTELPKTEAELQALIDAKVEEARESISKEYDGKFAAQRTKHEEEIKKIKASVGKSAEEIAQERISEQQQKDADELAELRAYKKRSILGEKLAKQGLPNYFINDNRLLSADETTIDKVIKDVKKEYEDSLPKGTTHSSVVQTASGKPATSEKDQANAAFGQALKDLIGR